MDALRYDVEQVAICDHNSTRGNKQWIIDNGGKLELPIHEIDGVYYINAVEISVCLDNIKDENGIPFNFHIKVLGADQRPESPLEQLIAIKEDNDNFVSYEILQYLALQIGVKLDPAYIKDYISERRVDDPKFSKFDADAALDFLDTYNLTQGRSERELTKILRNVQRPKRVHIDVKDAIELAHASGGIVTMAHPSKSLSKLSPENQRKVIEQLLLLGIDGFERIYNAATPEVNAMIDECQAAHYTVNEYVDDAGSDNHHVSHGCHIGHKYTEPIPVSATEVLFKELCKRQYELLNGLAWHRVYPPKSEQELNRTINFYRSLNDKFKREFVTRTSPGGTGSGTRS